MGDQWGQAQEPFAVTWRFRTADSVLLDPGVGEPETTSRLPAPKVKKLSHRGKKLTVAWKAVPGAEKHRVRIKGGGRTIRMTTTRPRLTRQVTRKPVRITIWAVAADGTLGKAHRPALTPGP